MPLHLEARGLVSAAADRPDTERIAFFDGLCRLRNGDLLCGFTVGTTKHAADGTIRLCRSRDGGNTWGPIPFQFPTRIGTIPGSLAGAELIEVEPGRLLLATTWYDRTDPTRPLFDPVTEGILRSRQLLAVSADDGETWSEWAEIPTPGLTGCAMTGPWVAWPDGTIAFAFESFKEYDDPRPARHAAWLVSSRDGGRSFGLPFRVAQHPLHEVYYWDQRVVAAGPSGEFLALFWTHHLAMKRDLPVHLLRGSLNDGEASREQPRDAGISGQIAAPLIWNDDRFLAFVVDRNDPCTMTLWESNDGGANWLIPDRLVVHVHDERAALSQGRENIDFKQYWEDMGKWSFGHPSILRLDNERALLTFYAGAPDRMDVHWARVRVA